LSPSFKIANYKTKEIYEESPKEPLDERKSIREITTRYLDKTYIFKTGVNANGEQEALIYELAEK